MKHLQQYHRNYRNQQGAGFIEVLVALVVLAIGLLGVMSMQVQGMNSNQRSLFVSEVNLLAYDMADRLFAFNVIGASSGEYDGISSLANGCDAVAGVVQWDCNDWVSLINNSSLPSGRGNVSWDNATDTYTIIIRWDAERTGAAGLTCPSTARDANGNLQNLTCFQLEVSLPNVHDGTNT